MIILEARGGIGSQFFQYAYLKNLQRFYKDKEAAIDISIPNREKGNGDGGGGNGGFMLDNFCIDENIKLVVRSDYKLSFANKLWRFIISFAYGHKFLRWMLFFLRPLAIIFGGFIFEEVGLKPPKLRRSFCKIKTARVYVSGEEFFKPVENEIRKDFVLKQKIEIQNKEVYESIQNSNSVCVHLRLGDYLKFAQIFDTLCENYYEKAFAYIKSKVDNPKFFIFSNDLELARIKLADVGENIVFVDNNQNTIEDFRLMSACKHFIIPNSSFSWWAQYLNENSDKIVVAPKVWLNNLPYKHLLMDSWITF